MPTDRNERRGLASRAAPSRALAFALSLAAALTGCTDRINPAVGSNADVSLYTTLARTDAALIPLVESLEREIYTTRKEPAFDVEFVLPGSFDRRRDFKNHLLVTPLEGAPEMRRLVERIVGGSVLAEFERGERPFAIYSDVFAAGQTIIVVAAPDHDALEAIVRATAEVLYDSLEARVIRGLSRSLFVRGEHADLTGYLERTRDYTVRVPKGFDVEEDPDRDLLIAHIQTPERWFFVQRARVAESSFTGPGVLAFRRSQPRIYADEEIRDEDLVIENGMFAGHPAVHLSGRWQSSSYVVGGPMRLHAIHVNGVLYVVDYLMFLPDPMIPKLPYLRQLEAVAQTFELPGVE